MKYRVVASSSLVLAIAAIAAPAGAQDSATMHVTVHVPDSVAHVTDRELPSHARFAIVSRDGQAALLLMDTTIVAQMTDRGLARINARETEEVFRDVEIGKGPLMESFSPDDAKAFAARARAARANLAR